MLGTDRNTGKPLSGLAHLRQSIADILTTPLGSRVGRRTYGSRLFALVDAPLTSATLVDIYHAAAEAIINWEPRLQVTSVKVAQVASGQLLLDVVGKYLPDGVPVTLEGIVVS
jgi:uncharacterized protein